MKTWSRYSTCLSVKLGYYIVQDFGLYHESTGPPLLRPTDKLELHIVFLVSSLKTISWHLLLALIIDPILYTNYLHLIYYSLILIQVSINANLWTWIIQFTSLSLSYYGCENEVYRNSYVLRILFSWRDKSLVVFLNISYKEYL